MPEPGLQTIGEGLLPCLQSLKQMQGQHLCLEAAPSSISPRQPGDTLLCLCYELLPEVVRGSYRFSRSYNVEVDASLLYALVHPQDRYLIRRSTAVLNDYQRILVGDVDTTQNLGEPFGDITILQVIQRKPHCCCTPSSSTSNKSPVYFKGFSPSRPCLWTPIRHAGSDCCTVLCSCDGASVFCPSRD